MSVNVKVVGFAVVILAISLHATHCAKDSTKNVTFNEVVIGGLFSLHCERRRDRSISCGDFRLDGYEELNALLFAVKEINKDPDILPGIDLRVKIEDTCSSVEIATEKCLNYTMTNYRFKYECTSNQLMNDPPILAIVGERDSDISRTVTNLVGLFHIPVISYGSTSPFLSGVNYFLRTIPPDTFIAQAMVDLLKKFHWNYIILLYSDSEYGRYASNAFRERIRKFKNGTENICVAVDEAIGNTTSSVDSGPGAQNEIWMKMEGQQQKTKVVVVFASYVDFSSFLQIGKKSYDVKKYIWLSDNVWNGQTSNLASELRYAISIIPHQVFIKKFADFFHNASSELPFIKRFASIDIEWFREYRLLPSHTHSQLHPPSSAGGSCFSWHSSQVTYVIDAVYSVAHALHNIIQRNTSRSYEQLFSSDILSAIKQVKFKNPWTKNHEVSFTNSGDPRSVEYAIVSLRQTEIGNCFTSIGQWKCFVNESNETCEGNLTMENELFSMNVSTLEFRGVCGKSCPAGQYKVVDKDFASCCWKCKNCTGNKYTHKPDLSFCTPCRHEQWPNANHTACIKIKPKTSTLISHPESIIILAINSLGLLLVLLLAVLIAAFSQSKMKIFSDRILCYLLLFGICITYVSSIIVLTDTNKERCLLLIFLSKIGQTCTIANLLVKTNTVYRAYKKKILKEDRRFLSQGMKVVVVISLVIIELILTWLSVNFEDKKKEKTRTVYLRTETENTAYLQCGYLLNYISKDVFTVLEFSFYWGLLLICVHQAYLTRKVTDNNHGLRYVFFCSSAALGSSILTMFASCFTDSQPDIKELIFSVHHTFFATAVFGCIFVPKIDILVFHPEKDALHDALSTSVVSNMDSMFQLSTPSQFIQDNPCSSNTPQM